MLDTICLPESGFCNKQDSDLSATQKYEAVVVGAGPAGITVVGNLIEQKKTPILWVDNEFQGGRLNKCYREVPRCNTKVKLFVAFCDALSSFRKVEENTPRPNAYTHLQALRQDGTCHIAEAADLCLMLTQGLNQTFGVYKRLGTVSSASQSDNSNWSITLECSSNNVAEKLEINSNILILCTGSYPKTNPLPVSHLQEINLDIALKPTLLSSNCPKDFKITVAVIGASHSAILVLRNFYNLARSSHQTLRIKWFTRHPLRYAEERDGWILNDNTGLKGEVSIWAKENLEAGKLELSPVGKYLEKIETSKKEDQEVHVKHLNSCTHVVQAIGFIPHDIPIMERNGKKMNPNFNHDLQIFEENGKKVVGLFGAGIAWPQRVTDPEGHVSLDVGLWKFMKSAKKAAPLWHGAS
ncbi:hypothetical protein OnM2_085032 [Erysiphe neolycopersici]|uniref:FAD/NAD(P)-binding domain-containing protein n=1 Tax=Erysiphe neolycopersici TaxID=212602 RepID=A0A420HF30_9PEZI|nr:hypothetical protein OnM2_085032 [Erysiphe neolycopersici]